MAESFPVPHPHRGRVLLLWLLLLSVVPVTAGLIRLAQLFRRAEITAENARFFASPLPVSLHITSASAFALLGAFEFSRGLRGPRGRWHRVRGWILLPSGVIAALTGLWMSLVYPLPAHDGDLLLTLRVGFGAAMLGFLLLGVWAIRRRDIQEHRAWMLRGYAIGMGAGTQVLTNVPWLLFFGEPDTFERALLMGAGWFFNLGVAEWVLWRHQGEGGVVFRSRRDIEGAKSWQQRRKK